MNNIFQNLLSLLGILGGCGGLFTFIIQWRSNNREDCKTSADEWKRLYDTMTERLKTQEELNKELRKEVDSLRANVISVTAELENYKKYDNYITEIELYTNDVLAALHPLISEDAYRTIEKKRPPKRVFNK